MSEISPAQLLSQIRTMGQDLQPGTPVESAPDSKFGDMLKSTLEAVNETQQTSRDLKIGFETGTTDASLAEVMIASQKADLSFRAVTEVRNKLVTAYQDIMNMPV